MSFGETPIITHFKSQATLSKISESCHLYDVTSRQPRCIPYYLHRLVKLIAGYLLHVYFFKMWYTMVWDGRGI